MTFVRAFSNKIDLGGSPITVTFSSAAANGNVLVAFALGSNNTGTRGAPAGWIAGPEYKTQAGISLASFYKVANAEGTTYAFTDSGGNLVHATVLEYSGIDNTTPLDIPGLTNGALASAVPVLKALGDATPGSTLVGAVGDDAGGAISGFASMTNRVAATSTFPANLSVYDEISDSQASRSGAIAGAQGWGSIMLRLRNAVVPSVAIDVHDFSLFPKTALVNGG